MAEMPRTSTTEYTVTMTNRGRSHSSCTRIDEPLSFLRRYVRHSSTTVNGRSAKHTSKPNKDASLVSHSYPGVGVGESVAMPGPEASRAVGRAPSGSKIPVLAEPNVSGPPHQPSPRLIWGS